MIFVKQDASKIPQEWLEKVRGLQAELDQLATSEARKAFIDRHSTVWGEIKKQLLEMSYKKCWYSEAPDAVSDWHVDHFRPKGRAIDVDDSIHEGYHWLAFDWKNYRIAGSFSNSPHKDADGITHGKWDYFPLAKGSAHASWVNRDCGQEICLLLDPTKPSDPKLITFNEDCIAVPADPENPIAVHKVKMTVHYLFLDNPTLIAARKRKWRDTIQWIEEYRDCCPGDIASCTAEHFKRFERHINRLSELTGPESPFASTSRACLRVNGLDTYIKAPEETLVT